MISLQLIRYDPGSPPTLAVHPHLHSFLLSSISSFFPSSVLPILFPHTLLTFFSSSSSVFPSPSLPSFLIVSYSPLLTVFIYLCLPIRFYVCSALPFSRPFPSSLSPIHSTPPWPAHATNHHHPGQPTQWFLPQSSTWSLTTSLHLLSITSAPKITPN